MVADEADRLHENALMASRFQRENSLFDGWPQPFSAGHSLALEGESPNRDTSGTLAATSAAVSRVWTS